MSVAPETLRRPWKARSAAPEALLRRSVPQVSCNAPAGASPPKIPPSRGDVVGEAIIDEEKGHYEVMFVGWDGSRRIHGTALHIDMIGDQIWTQHDGTEPGVAEELLETGIPRESIVLGFRPAFVRQHTGFATG